MSSENTPSQKLHPLIIIATICLILFSLVGIASFMGWLPNRSTPVTNQNTSTPAVNAKTNSENSKSTQKSADKATPKEKSVHKELSQHRSTMHNPSNSLPSRPVVATCDNCGVIAAINSVHRPSADQSIGAGTVAGAVVGGLVGNQIGHGCGRKAATLLGAVGGGYVGHQIESQTRTENVFEVEVRMEDGRVLSFAQQPNSAWRVGDRVRVIDGQLVSR